MIRVNEPRYLGNPADIRAGVRLGAFFGLLFAVKYGFAAYVNNSRPLASSDGSPFLIAAITLSGGILAGAIVGAFRPFARMIWGAVVLGTVVAFPVVVATDAVRSRVSYPPAPIRWEIDILSSIIIGAIGGLVARMSFRSDRAA